MGGSLGRFSLSDALFQPVGPHPVGAVLLGLGQLRRRQIAKIKSLWMLPHFPAHFGNTFVHVQFPFGDAIQIGKPAHIHGAEMLAVAAFDHTSVAFMPTKITFINNANASLMPWERLWVGVGHVRQGGGNLGRFGRRFV